jgi:hypothetical protein
MPTQFHPDDVRLMLSYPHSTTGSHPRRVDIEAERASDGVPLFRLSLSADDFANLMASRGVVARSWTRAGQAFCPDPADHEPPCEETQHDTRGDCNGKVRAYEAFVSEVLGHRKGDTLHLCAAHAQLRGPQIIRANTPAVKP